MQQAGSNFQSYFGSPEAQPLQPNEPQFRLAGFVPSTHDQPLQGKERLGRTADRMQREESSRGG